jgi:putative FmdB family regulatory protein
MPIYEFRCEECKAEFEGLFEAGVQSAPCPECGSERTVRRFSSIGRSLHLVKTQGENRRQERRNAELQASARKRHKETRQRMRDKTKRTKPPGGAT